MGTRAGPSREGESTAWHLRDATPDDAGLIAKHRYFNEREAESDLSTYAAWLAPRLADGRYVGKLAVTGPTVVGGVGIVLLDWGPTRGSPDGRQGRVVNAFVDSDWRRYGIARMLLKAALERCRSLGISRYSLATTDEALGLYAGEGFESRPSEMTLRDR